MSARERIWNALTIVMKEDEKLVDQCVKEFRKAPPIPDKRKIVIAINDSESEDENVPIAPVSRKRKRIMEGSKSRSEQEQESVDHFISPPDSGLRIRSNSMQRYRTHSRSSNRSWSQGSCTVDFSLSPIMSPGEVSSRMDLATILEREFANMRGLLGTCPCRVSGRDSSNDEDFRLRDIQSERTRINQFKASMAYLSLAAEFHAYEVQQHQMFSKQEPKPKLQLLCEGQYDMYRKHAKNRRVATWAELKGFKDLKLIKESVTLGRKLCFLRILLTKELNLRDEQQCSIIPVLLRTFATKRLNTITWEELAGDAKSLARSNRASELLKKWQDWFSACSKAYCNANGNVLVSLRHTCELGSSTPSTPSRGPRNRNRSTPAISTPSSVPSARRSNQRGSRAPRRSRLGMNGASAGSEEPLVVSSINRQSGVLSSGPDRSTAYAPRIMGSNESHTSYTALYLPQQRELDPDPSSEVDAGQAGRPLQSQRPAAAQILPSSTQTGRVPDHGGARHQRGVPSVRRAITGGSECPRPPIPTSNPQPYHISCNETFGQHLGASAAGYGNVDPAILQMIDFESGTMAVGRGIIEKIKVWGSLNAIDSGMITDQGYESTPTPQNDIELGSSHHGTTASQTYSTPGQPDLHRMNPQ